MTTKTSEFTGKHMLLITCSFFAVVIGVNVFMAVSASRTWTGLVVENSYVESQQFQEKHGWMQSQVDAGWQLATRYADGTLVFSAVDAEGKPLALDGVSAFIRRPVGGHDDQTVPLAATDSGYTADVPLASGVWDITVTTSETALGPINFERRVSVP